MSHVTVTSNLHIPTVPFCHSVFISFRLLILFSVGYGEKCLGVDNLRSPLRMCPRDVLRPATEWEADARSWRTPTLKRTYSDGATEHFDRVFQTRFILFITCLFNEDVSSSGNIASDSLPVSVWQIGQTVQANTHRRS